MKPSPRAYWICLKGVVWREALRFVHQRERFFAALVRPLVWLVVFAAGFRSILGVSIVEPYETYITYGTYIVPGLVAMIHERSSAYLRRAGRGGRAASPRLVSRPSGCSW